MSVASSSRGWTPTAASAGRGHGQMAAWRGYMTAPPSHIRKYRVFAIVLVALVDQGCTSVARHTSSAEVSAIRVGEATKSDVIGMLGLPGKVDKPCPGVAAPLECWTYYAISGRRTIVYPVGAVPGYDTITYLYANMTLEERAKIAGIVVFDAKERVVEIKLGGE